MSTASNTTIYFCKNFRVGKQIKKIGTGTEFQFCLAQKDVKLGIGIQYFTRQCICRNRKSKVFSTTMLSSFSLGK